MITHFLRKLRFFVHIYIKFPVPLIHSLGLPRWLSCILRPFHMGDSARRIAGQYLLMV